MGNATMPKAFWVVTYRSISNPDAMTAYAKFAGPAITEAGGRFLARGMPVKPYEAGMDQRVVLIEFDFEGDTIDRLGMPAEHRH